MVILIKIMIKMIIIKIIIKIIVIIIIIIMMKQSSPDSPTRRGILARQLLWQQANHPK